MTISDAIERLANCWTGEDRKHVLRRLTHLYCLTCVDDEESDLTVDSLGCCFDFFESMGSEFVCPSMTVSPNGELVLTWRIEGHSTVGMEFCDNGSVEYGIVPPSLVISHSGCENCHEVGKILSTEIDFLRKKYC